MGEQDEVKNTITDIKKYLSTPENPVDMGEFKEFWDSCTDEEKEEFKKTPLPESE